MLRAVLLVGHASTVSRSCQRLLLLGMPAAQEPSGHVNKACMQQRVRTLSVVTRPRPTHQQVLLLSCAEPCWPCPWLPPLPLLRDLQVLSFVQQHTEYQQAQLAGNSVHVDRVYLQRYMPELNDHLHYRIVDVSTIKELCR